MTTITQADWDEDLTDEIAEAISDTLDVDWQPRWAAPNIIAIINRERRIARLEGAKAMQEVLDALSKAGPIHAGPVGGDLGRKYPDARQCVIEFAPEQAAFAYDLHSVLVRLRALDSARIAGGGK